MSNTKRGTIPIDQVVENLFVRTELNTDHVVHLGTLYEADTKLPPIKVARNSLLLVDGRHRLAARKMLGLKSVEVEWVDETEKSEIIAQALKANIGGSLPPTNADIVYAIHQMLSEGTPASAVGKMLGTTWPPAVTRRFIADAQSAMNKERLNKARAAVVDDGMTLGEAAIQFKVKPDALRVAMGGGKAARRKGVAEIKGTLTGVFRSRGGSMGAVMKKVQQRMEDGDLSWSAVESVLDHCDSLCKHTTHSVRDWRRRLEAKAGKTKKEK